MYTTYIHITISNETIIGSLLLTDYKYQSIRITNHILLGQRNNYNNI